MRLAPLALLTSACLSRELSGVLDELPPCSTGLASETAGDGSTDPASSSDTTADPSTLSGTATGEASTGTTTDAPGSTTDTGESTAAVPVCGDGVVDGDEECDDGNLVPDDGCSDACAADLRVFVSSRTYAAGDLMSLYLADAQCLQLAGDALEFTGRFRAWLSDSRTDARDLVSGRGRLVMVNGLVFAESWDALLAGEVLAPLEVTEKSETYHGPVWTGTRPDGTAVPDSEHCDDWSSNSALKSAYYGNSDEISSEWTLAEQFDNPIDCGAPLAIYCFEEL
jgi:cysteine-rich repeat protein